MTLVFMTSPQSSTDSPCQILSWSSDADDESGGALGPETPALVTRAEISCGLGEESSQL